MRNERFCRRGQAQGLPFAFLPGGIALFAILTIVAVLLGLWVDVSNAQAPVGTYDEEEAQAIDQMLMCPVCPAESIDQAQVPLARQMRQRVREMLSEGASSQEVLEYFALRYGTDVLASPPKSGLNLLAWILPVIGVVAALGAGLLVLKAMTGRKEGPAEGEPLTDPQDGDLKPYLAAVDRSLAIETEVDKQAEEEPREGNQ